MGPDYRTNLPNVLAIGDVIGGGLASLASKAGRDVARDLFEEPQEEVWLQFMGHKQGLMADTGLGGHVNRHRLEQLGAGLWKRQTEGGCRGLGERGEWVRKGHHGHGAPPDKKSAISIPLPEFVVPMRAQVHPPCVHLLLLQTLSSPSDLSPSVWSCCLGFPKKRILGTFFFGNIVRATIIISRRHAKCLMLVEGPVPTCRSLLLAWAFGFGGQSGNMVGLMDHRSPQNVAKAPVDATPVDVSTHAHAPLHMVDRHTRPGDAALHQAASEGPFSVCRRYLFLLPAVGGWRCCL